MFSGVHEILLIVLIILAILILPRLMARKRPQASAAARAVGQPVVVSGRLRLTIALSIAWLLIASAYFEPWNKDIKTFIYFGTGPVVVLWGGIWVIAGYKKHKAR